MIWPYNVYDLIPIANHQEFQDCSKRSRLQVCAENLLRDSLGNIAFWLFWNNYFLQNLVSTKFGSRKFISTNRTDYILSSLLDTRMEEPGRLQSMGSLSCTRLSDFTFTFHFYSLEKEMATHSGVLAWRTPGTGEPGGLPSLGSHRIGHDWSNLAAAAAAAYIKECMCVYVNACVCMYIFY